MPTVSQHYGHHAVPGAVDETRTRQQAAPVVLMVSGGADSTALLLMACTSKLDIQDGRGVAPIARERLHVLYLLEFLLFYKIKRKALSCKLRAIIASLQHFTEYL